jgi:hypothetical protein
MKIRIVAMALVFAVLGGAEAEACFRNSFKSLQKSSNQGQGATVAQNNMSPMALMGAISKSFEQKLSKKPGGTAEALKFFDKILAKLPDSKKNMIPLLTSAVMRAASKSKTAGADFANKILKKSLDKTKDDPALSKRTVGLSMIATGTTGSSKDLENPAKKALLEKFAKQQGIEGTDPKATLKEAMKLAPNTISKQFPKLTIYEKKTVNGERVDTKVTATREDFEKKFFELGESKSKSELTDIQKKDKEQGKRKRTLDQIILDTILDKSSGTLEAVSKQ